MESHTDKTSQSIEALSPWYRSAITTAVVCVGFFLLLLLSLFVIQFMFGAG